MKKLKKCMADGGKLPIDPVEAALARSRAKYGTADPTPEPPQQNQVQPAEKKPVEQDGQTVMEHIRSRADRLREAMDYEKARKFAGGGVAGVIRDGNSFYSDRAEGAAGAVPSIPGGANPAGVAAFQASVPSMAVGTGATPPNMVPTEAQGMAASGVLAGGSGGSFTAAAPAVATAPSAPGNVFANPQAGNVLASSGGLQTMAERSMAIGIDPSAAYRPGSAQDPHASGLTGPTAAQRVAGSNATAAALAPNQQVPQIANPLEMITARQQRQMSRTPGLADGGIPRTRFEGKGGPRDDKIPVTVAGEQIKVSDGEEAVILPAKTAGNPQALAAIGQVIEQSNDGRKPAMGIEAGGRYAGGALKYPYDDEQPPTAQQIYAGAGRGIGDAIATHAFPSAAGAIQKYGDAAQRAAEQGNYGGAVGQVGRGVVAGGIGVADDVMRSAARVLDPAANALKTLVTGDSSPARPSAERVASHQGLPAAIGNEGQQRAVGAANIAPTPDLSQGPGDARFNEATGTLHFTDKNYDPTTQQFPDGGGAITGKNGKTVVIAPQGIASTAGTGPRDAHGNDMTQTLALREELNRARADNAWSNLNAVNPAYQQKGMAQLQALAGIGALDSEATKRIALRQQQQREDDTAALLQEKTRGEVANSTAARIAREGLVSAYDVGDQAAINKAKLKAIAAGALKEPVRHDDYHLSSDPLGNQTRLNKVTGAMETLDRATNTLKPVVTASQVPEFASESDLRIAQKAGKVKVGQVVSVGGRSGTVTPL